MIVFEKKFEAIAILTEYYLMYLRYMNFVIVLYIWD